MSVNTYFEEVQNLYKSFEKINQEMGEAYNDSPFNLERDFHNISENKYNKIVCGYSEPVSTLFAHLTELTTRVQKAFKNVQNQGEDCHQVFDLLNRANGIADDLLADIVKANRRKIFHMRVQDTLHGIPMNGNCRSVDSNSLNSSSSEEVSGDYNLNLTDEERRELEKSINPSKSTPTPTLEEIFTDRRQPSPPKPQPSPQEMAGLYSLSLSAFAKILDRLQNNWNATQEQYENCLDDIQTDLAVLESEVESTVPNVKNCVDFQGVADPIYNHLYFIHKKESPEKITGDPKHGTHAFFAREGLNATNEERVRAVQRGMVQFAVLSIHLGLVTNNKELIKNGLDILETNSMKLHERDTLPFLGGNSNIAHYLHGKFYDACKEAHKQGTCLVHPDEYPKLGRHGWLDDRIPDRIKHGILERLEIDLQPWTRETFSFESAESTND